MNPDRLGIISSAHIRAITSRLSRDMYGRVLVGIQDQVSLIV